MFNTFKVTHKERNIDFTAKVMFSSKEEMTAKEALATIRKGISEWVRTTKKGKEVWEKTQGRLNIHDLSEYRNDEGLDKCLENVGIIDLFIKIEIDEDISDTWDLLTKIVYDDVFNEAERTDICSEN